MNYPEILVSSWKSCPPNHFLFLSEWTHDILLGTEVGTLLVPGFHRVFVNHFEIPSQRLVAGKIWQNSILWTWRFTT